MARNYKTQLTNRLKQLANSVDDDTYLDEFTDLATNKNKTEPIIKGNLVKQFYNEG